MPYAGQVALLQLWFEGEETLLGDFSTDRPGNLPVPPVPEALLSLAASMTDGASVGNYGNHGKAPHN